VKDDPLIARKMEVADNVIPSANSSMAKDLHYLGLYLYNDDYIKKARQMLTNVKSDILKNGPFYSNWAMVLLDFMNPPYEVAIVGNDFAQKRKEFDMHFLPNILFLGGKKEGNLKLLKNKLVAGQTTIYVCQNKACKLPVTETEAALKLLNSNK